MGIFYFKDGWVKLAASSGVVLGVGKDFTRKMVFYVILLINPYRKFGFLGV